MQPSATEYNKRWKITKEVVKKRKQDGVIGVILVGSVARKECYPSSDIDLLVISEEKRQYHDEWIDGVPITTGCLTPTDIKNANDILKSELMKGKILHDPSGKLAETIQIIREDAWSRSLTEKDLKYQWMSSMSRAYEEYAHQTDDPYSAIVWHRVSAFYQTSCYLLKEHDVWKPRPGDLSYLGEHEETFEDIMRLKPLLKRAESIQELFEEFEDQLLHFVEQEKDRIDEENQTMVKRCASTHKSRLNAFFMENGDWVSGVFGYRNYVNQLYSYPIAEVYSIQAPHVVGPLLNVKTPETYQKLCTEINCFEKDIMRQLADISNGVESLFSRIITS